MLGDLIAITVNNTHTHTHIIYIYIYIYIYICQCNVRLLLYHSYQRSVLFRPAHCMVAARKTNKTPSIDIVNVCILGHIVLCKNNETATSCISDKYSNRTFEILKCQP